jgi:iron transport multicopper oxidase
MLTTVVLLATFASYSFAKTVEYNWDITWVYAAPDGFHRPVIGTKIVLQSEPVYGNVG